MSLNPLAKGLHLSHNFYDIERVDVIRKQHEVMNNLIGFTSEEAEATLQHVYSLFEDQVLDPVALGGVPGHITQYAQNSLQTNCGFNPFYTRLLYELTATVKIMMTPKELEEDLETVLAEQLYVYACQYHGNELIRWDIDLSHQDAVLISALANYKSMTDIKEYWEEIIQKLVELLAWRHLERLAPPEGGAADRQ